LRENPVKPAGRTVHGNAGGLYDDMGLMAQMEKLCVELCLIAG